MSGYKNKGKDKGKNIQRAEDYQIITQHYPTKIPVYNKFQLLDDFPTLPCKTTATASPATSSYDNSSPSSSQNHPYPCSCFPLDPILFYLRDYDLYYTSFAGSRYNEYAIFVDFREWQVSGNLPFYNYLKIIKAYKSLLQILNSHPVLIIIPTGCLETIRYYNDYFITWIAYDQQAIQLVTKFFPDSHLCPLDQFLASDSNDDLYKYSSSSCISFTDYGPQCKVLKKYSTKEFKCFGQQTFGPHPA